MTKKITLIFALFGLLASFAFGQSTNTNLVLTATKLSAALTQSSNTLRVASATGITATSTILYLDDGSSKNGEAVFVNAVNGTTISVTRGYNGTQANPHLSGTVVLIGSAGAGTGPNGPFVSVDPSGFTLLFTLLCRRLAIAISSNFLALF